MTIGRPPRRACRIRSDARDGRRRPRGGLPDVGFHARAIMAGERCDALTFGTR
jgi:hypothetical protein